MPQDMSHQRREDGRRSPSGERWGERSPERSAEGGPLTRWRARGGARPVVRYGEGAAEPARETSGETSRLDPIRRAAPTSLLRRPDRPKRPSAAELDRSNALRAALRRAQAFWPGAAPAADAARARRRLAWVGALCALTALGGAAAAPVFLNAAAASSAPAAYAALAWGASGLFLGLIALYALLGDALGADDAPPDAR